MSNIYKTLQAFLVAIGGAYSSGQNLPGSIGLHEQAGIWISWCCRMFGIIKYPWNFSSESLCGERTGGGEVDIPKLSRSILLLFGQKRYKCIGIAHPAI